jgi:hypothetical protein
MQLAKNRALIGGGDWHPASSSLNNDIMRNPAG